MILSNLKGNYWELLQQAQDDGGGEVNGETTPQEPPAGGAFEGEEYEEVYVEGVDSPPPEEEGTKPDPEELQKQNQDLQQQLEQLKQQADLGQNLQQSISQLGENLQQPRRTQGQNRQQTQAQQQPGESEEEFAKRVRENFYDDPYKVLNEFQYRKLQPFMAQMVNNNLSNSKRFLQVDPNKKGTYSQYSEEIEEEVQQMPFQEKMNDPQVYDKAYERVMARHMDDIIEQKVQERMEQSKEQTPPSRPETPQSESSQYKPSGQPKRKIKKLTRQEALAADNKGIPRGQYYDYLVERGMKQ